MGKQDEDDSDEQMLLQSNVRPEERITKKKNWRRMRREDPFRLTFDYQQNKRENSGTFSLVKAIDVSHNTTSTVHITSQLAIRSH